MSEKILLKKLLVDYLIELLSKNENITSEAGKSTFSLTEIINNTISICLSDGGKQEFKIDAVIDVYEQYSKTLQRKTKYYPNGNRHRTYTLRLAVLFHEYLENNDFSEAYNEIEDSAVFEGIRQLQERQILSRNHRLAEDAKIRDDFTCQGCGYRKCVNDKFIIDCHHLRPLSLTGKTMTSLDDLICLCPNCHRIVHTSEPPLGIKQLRELFTLMKV